MMMEGKSSKPEAGQQNWRAEFTAETRHKVVNAIATSLKKREVANSQPDDFSKKIYINAKQFEEKTFQTATTKAHYVNTINRKIRLSPEQQPRSSPGFSSNSLGNICPSSQGMPASSELAAHQVCQQQELKNEILKDKARDTNNSQQEQRFTPPQSNHLTLAQLSNNTLLQQQSRQQRPNLKLNATKVVQQSMGRQSDASVQSHASNMQLHQHSARMLQQGGGFTAAELNAQKVKQDSQNQSSNESKALTENANLGDQDDLSYRKLQAMKRQYGPYLLHLYKQFTGRCNKATGPEQLLLFQNHLKFIKGLLNMLALEKSQITPMHKERMDRYPQIIENFIKPIMKKKPPSVELKPQVFQPPSDPMNSALKTSLQTSSSVQPGVPNSQPNVCRSQKYGSAMEWEQKNVSGEMRQTLRPSGESVLDAPLQCNTLLNPVEASLNHHQSMVSPPNVKQHEHPQLERQHIMIQNTKTSTIQGIEAPVNPHQTPVPAIPRQPHVTSSQMSQNASLLLGKKTLSSQSKSGIPLQSVAASPVVMYSTPLTPSSILLNEKRECSGVSPTTMSEEHRKPEPQSSLAQADTKSEIYNQSPVTPGLMPPPILPESTRPYGNEHSSVQKQPFERLIKAVERLSEQELSAAYDEIMSVVNMVEAFAGTEYSSDSRSAIGEDLGAGARCNALTENFSSHGSINARAIMHQTSAITSDISFSVGTTDGEKCQQCNFDSTSTSRIKRQRTSKRDYLLYEIKSINQSLVETMIDLESNEDPVTAEAFEGTIVSCSYNAVALSEDIKRSAATSLMFPELTLRLCIPPNYPDSSPVILDNPVGGRRGINDSEGLLEETMTRYVLSLRKFSEPMSIGDMARSWDSCARAEIFKRAKLIGGECFSSRYGSWENCTKSRKLVPGRMEDWPNVY